jgi:hypothetical protein
MVLQCKNGVGSNPVEGRTNKNAKKKKKKKKKNK